MTMTVDQDEIINTIAEKFNVDKKCIKLAVTNKYDNRANDLVPIITAEIDTKNPIDLEHTCPTYNY